jgi:hypothetical protein
MNDKISQTRQVAAMLAFAAVLTIFANLVTSPTFSAAAVHDNRNQKSKDKSKDPYYNWFGVTSSLPIPVLNLTS